MKEIKFIGMGKGFRDTRGTLFFDIARIIIGRTLFKVKILRWQIYTPQVYYIVFNEVA